MFLSSPLLPFQGIAQAYKVVGSFEVLGNPIDAVSRLGEGVKDFFYAPAEGLMQACLWLDGRASVAAKQCHRPCFSTTHN